MVCTIQSIDDTVPQITHPVTGVPNLQMLFISYNYITLNKDWVDCLMEVGVLQE